MKKPKTPASPKVASAKPSDFVVAQMEHHKETMTQLISAMQVTVSRTQDELIRLAARIDGKDLSEGWRYDMDRHEWVLMEKKSPA